jgi:hypothetical protein
MKVTAAVTAPQWATIDAAMDNAAHNARDSFEVTDADFERVWRSDNA